MAKYNLNWRETDAQLLEALLLGTGGDGEIALLDVLLMIDATDGDVPEMQELQQSMEKLLAVNYLRVKKNKLGLTASFMQEYSGTTTEAENEREQLFSLLQTKELTPESMEEGRTYLKKYKLRNYYQAYLEQFGG